MNETNELKNEMGQDILTLANKYSADRIKISTMDFERDYQRGQDGNLYLVSEKAVIRTLGKLTKVPIGENQTYKTFEDAEKATKKYWQGYYKKVRLARSDKDKLAEARRQKRYRAKRQQEKSEFKERM